MKMVKRSTPCSIMLRRREKSVATQKSHTQDGRREIFSSCDPLFHVSLERCTFHETCEIEQSRPHDRIVSDCRNRCYCSVSALTASVMEFVVRHKRFSENILPCRILYVGFCCELLCCRFLHNIDKIIKSGPRVQECLREHQLLNNLFERPLALPHSEKLLPH